jgi:hypothetical protein
MNPDLPTLRDFLSRVEAATGADPELDARLLCLFAAPAGSVVEQSRINGAWTVFEPASGGNRPAVWNNRAWARAEGWPLTSSLEAALDFAERLYRSGPRAHWVAGRHAWPIPENRRHYALFPWGSGTAASPALAVLAAILSARIIAAEQRAPVIAKQRQG